MRPLLGKNLPRTEIVNPKMFGKKQGAFFSHIIEEYNYNVCEKDNISGSNKRVCLK